MERIPDYNKGSQISADQMPSTFLGPQLLKSIPRIGKKKGGWGSFLRDFLISYTGTTYLPTEIFGLLRVGLERDVGPTVGHDTVWQQDDSLGVYNIEGL